MAKENTRKLPFMPFYPGDYLRDTRHLSTLQHGAYFLLILEYWIKGGLPNDDNLLARIAGLAHRDWLKMRPIISKFFQQGWIHQRIDVEIEKAKDKSIKRAEAGKRGGDAKPLKTQDPMEAIAQANGEANGKQTGSKIPSKTQASSSDSTYENKAEALSSYSGSSGLQPTEPRQPYPYAELSDEERFWKFAPKCEEAGISRGRLGRLQKLIGAGALDYSEAMRIITNSLRATAPSGYFGKICEGYERDAEIRSAPKTPKRGPKIPEWVEAGRSQGEIILSDGPGKWMWRGYQYDDEQKTIGF